MANDYNGYIATYREYQRGDHYRKALTGWGPHSSDYFATRLVQMGGHAERRRRDLPAEPGQREGRRPTQAHQRRSARTVLGADRHRRRGGLRGRAARRRRRRRRRQPARRTSSASRAAFFNWDGGSNYTDNPRVTVQRQATARWADFADQSGEIPVTVKYPQGEDVPSYLQGDQAWKWTAHFEAFAANFDTGMRARACDAGRHLPLRRRRHAPRGRRAASVPPRVETVRGAAVDRDHRERPARGPGRTGQLQPSGRGTRLRDQRRAAGVRRDRSDRLPGQLQVAGALHQERAHRRSATRPRRPTRSKFEWYCFTCTFRPWADTGDAEVAYLTIVDPGGVSTGTRRAPAATAGR